MVLYAVTAKILSHFIWEKLIDFLKQGIECGEIRSDIEVLPTIFSFWGMISGLIQIATNKELYIGQRMEKSKMEFLNYGFDMIYDAIIVDGKMKKNV